MSESDSHSKNGASTNLAAELDDIFGDDGDGARAPITGFLVGLSGKHAGKLFRIRPGESIIGRSSKALVTLDEKAISHQHARLMLDGRGCFLTDLDSTNGTTLNGERIFVPHELHAGDVIGVGNTTLGYLTDAEDQEQHTRALARVTHPVIGGTRSMGAGAIVPAAGGPGMQLSSPSAAVPLGGLDQALDLIGTATGFLTSYWKLIAASAVVVAGVGVSSMKIFPPQATAEFEIFLRQDQTKSTAQHFATRSIEYFTAAEKNFLNVELVRKTTLDMDVIPGGESPRGLAKNLEFARDGQTTFVGRFKHRDHSFAEHFLAQHLKNYLEQEIGKSIKVLSSEVELLRSQFENNEALLKESEGALRDFKQEHVNALPEQAVGQMGSRGSLLSQRDTLSAALVRSQKELELARQQLASEDAFVGERVQRSQPYEQGLVDVRRQIAAAQAQGFAEGHPDLVRLRNEEKSLLELKERTMASSTTETDRRANPEHKRLTARVGELQVDVASTSAELGQVEARLAQLSDLAEKMPEVEAQVSDKLRKVSGSVALHDRLYEQLKAKELELEFERASIAARYDVIQPPRAFPLNPTRSTLLRAGAGSVAGAFLGIILALAHWLRSYATRRRTMTGASKTGIVLSD